MAKPPIYNPAALREALVTANKQIRTLQGQLSQVGQQLLTLQQADQKLHIQNMQLMGFLCALVYEAGGELSLHFSTIKKLPDTSGVIPDFREQHDLVVLRYAENAPAAQAALEARAADASAAPPEPDPQTTCPNTWHDDTSAPGIRCIECGGKGKRTVTTQ